MPNWLIVPLFIFFIFGRLFSYFQSSVPLGYDFGLYLYALKQYSQVPITTFSSLSPIISVDFAPSIPFMLRSLDKLNLAGRDTLLIFLAVSFSVILLATLYLLAKKLWGVQAALWAVLIFASSAIQYRAYWYYYLQNIAAMSFFLLTIFFLIGRSYFAIPAAIMVAYTHRPTLALLLVSLVGGIFFDKKARKFYLTVTLATIGAGAIYYIPTFEKTVLPLLAPIWRSVSPESFLSTGQKASGTFYDLKTSLLLTLVYLPFAVLGIKKFAFNKKSAALTIPLIATLLIVILRLFFYRRFFIFLDMFLVLFAGVGVVAFTKKVKSVKLKRVFVVVYFAILLIFAGIFIYKTGKPLIYEDEFREIKMLAETEKDAYVLVTDRYYMPWIYGWSERKPISPGFGQYDIYWTANDWQQFWMSGSRETEKRLLLKLPKPLYIYAGNQQHLTKFDLVGECFERVNWRTYKFICER